VSCDAVNPLLNIELELTTNVLLELFPNIVLDEIINIIENTLKYYETSKNKILEYQKYVTNTYNLNKYIDKLEEIINNTK
jgi:hypothetical protein